MQILLILNKRSPETRVIVRVDKKSLREQVIALLEQNRDKEAFDLLVKKAQVEAYLPSGEKTNIRPALTLFEDLV